MGINPDLINMLTCGLGSGIAGIAGVVIRRYAKVTSEMGANDTVQSFMTVVLSGVDKAQRKPRDLWRKIGEPAGNNRKPDRPSGHWPQISETHRLRVADRARKHHHCAEKPAWPIDMLFKRLLAMNRGQVPLKKPSAQAVRDLPLSHVSI